MIFLCEFGISAFSCCYSKKMFLSAITELKIEKLSTLYRSPIGTVILRYSIKQAKCFKTARTDHKLNNPNYFFTNSYTYS